ncbi:MAG: DNA repair protein RecO [Christensenellales bacterium]|jgi:DNA repair protein RecO (recombination protein O)
MIVTNALVLRRSEYKDNDRMLTLLSPELGRIDAIARGCRRQKSPLLNAAELFTAGEYALTETRGRYSVLSCQVTDSFFPIRTDVDLLTHGAYILSLLYSASQPNLPSEALFLLGLHALAHLAYAPLPPALTTFGFEMHLMHILGQSPSAVQCVRCGREIETGGRFDALAGGAICPRCFSGAPPISDGARRILHKAPRTKFESIALLEERPEWREAARYMREFTLDHMEVRPKAIPDLEEDAP